MEIRTIYTIFIKTNGREINELDLFIIIDVSDLCCRDVK